VNQSLLRFIIGGVIVSAFAIIGDVLKPKSLAGLFGAAPSVALATLAMTIVSDGASYAAIEGRSMMAGAVAFFVYASLVSRILMRYNFRAISVTLCYIEERLEPAQPSCVSQAPCCWTSLVHGSVREQNRRCGFKFFCSNGVCDTRRN
jgi:hypothetical protein